MIQKFSLIATLVIIVLSFLLFKQCDKSRELQSYLNHANDSVKIWRDEAGRSNAETAVLKANYKTLKDQLPSIIDSVKKLGIKPRSVKAITTAGMVIHDTIPFYDTIWFDDWSRFEWLDTTTLVYTIRDSIALVTHEKSYGFLGLKKSYVTRAVTFNPNTRLTGVKSIEIRPRPRRLSLGFYTGYGLQLSRDGVVRHGWSTGVGLNWRIF